MDLVFPTDAEHVESNSNIIQRGLQPAQVAAGVVDDDGKAKYTDFDALRHFYASWHINRRRDGGQGLPPKVVQDRLWHSTIAMTMDTYGHLFPRGDDSDEPAGAENALFVVNAT
jgi:integrase